MTDFPRTRIEDLSVSRMIIGTNWFLGFSHTSKAKDKQILREMTSGRIAEVLEVFLRAGVDTILGVRPEAGQLLDAIKKSEDAVGRGMITIATPHLNLAEDAPDGENEAILDAQAEIGARICMPHQASTDALLDRRAKRIRDMEKYCAMIRGRGMVPGLSTHMPETPGYADAQGLDVATYIQIYNAAGFLMQVEADWVHRVIWNAARPVMTIKPLAAGRLLPLVGLAFSWSTIRWQDMLAIGCMTGDEAREVIDISLSILNRTAPTVEVQKTRSKDSMSTP